MLLCESNQNDLGSRLLLDNTHNRIPSEQTHLHNMMLFPVTQPHTAYNHVVYNMTGMLEPGKL